MSLGGPILVKELRKPLTFAPKEDGYVPDYLTLKYGSPSYEGALPINEDVEKEHRGQIIFKSIVHFSADVTLIVLLAFLALQYSADVKTVHNNWAFLLGYSIAGGVAVLIKFGDWMITESRNVQLPSKAFDWNRLWPSTTFRHHCDNTVIRLPQTVISIFVWLLPLMPLIMFYGHKGNVDAHDIGDQFLFFKWMMYNFLAYFLLVIQIGSSLFHCAAICEPWYEPKTMRKY